MTYLDSKTSARCYSKTKQQIPFTFHLAEVNTNEYK